MTTKQQWFSMVRSSLVALGTAGAAAGAFLAREADAQAQARFGDKGQLAITGENLFSLSSERFGDSLLNNVETSTTVNRFGFLFSRCGAADGGSLPSPRCTQVGGHYFIIPSLSIGATLGYESRGGTQTGPVGQAIVTRDLRDESSFAFLPKVGYALMFSQVVGFWFRGGPGYFHDGSSQNGEQSHSYWLLSGDALFVVSPFQHFAFYVGPGFDFSFSGTRTETNQMGVKTSWGASYRDFGVGLGLIGYVDL
jgi:hypothetical protein